MTPSCQVVSLVTQRRIRGEQPEYFSEPTQDPGRRVGAVFRNVLTDLIEVGLGVRCDAVWRQSITSANTFCLDLLEQFSHHLLSIKKKSRLGLLPAVLDLVADRL